MMSIVHNLFVHKNLSVGCACAAVTTRSTCIHDLLHERYIAGDKLAPEIRRIHQGQSSLT